MFRRARKVALGGPGAVGQGAGIGAQLLRWRGAGRQGWRPTFSAVLVPALGLGLSGCGGVGSGRRVRPNDFGRVRAGARVSAQCIWWRFVGRRGWRLIALVGRGRAPGVARNSFDGVGQGAGVSAKALGWLWAGRRGWRPNYCSERAGRRGWRLMVSVALGWAAGLALNSLDFCLAHL